ncbi:hypothetical protein BH20CHL7_BH20CHL7_03890 [soil metagenome]
MRAAAPFLAFALAVSSLAIPAAHPLPARAADQVDPQDATATPADDQILIRYAPGTKASERRAIERAHGLQRLGDAPSRRGRTDVVIARGRSLATVRRLLAAEPAVEAVAPNHRRELSDDITGEPMFKQLWGLHNTGQKVSGTKTQTGAADVDIDAPEALRLGIGSPDVVVAVIDDGVDFSHVDLAGRAWTNPGEAGQLATNGIDDDGNGYIDDVHGWDCCNDDNSVHDRGMDGHGTHVAGTIAASLNGRGVVGVAPGVRIMALKFIDDDEDCGRDGMAVAAIDYAASFGVRIMNASWGGPQPSAVLEAAIAESGALFVAAAGNWGVDLDRPGGPRLYPASSTLPNVITVGAIDQTGKRAGFSNFGTTSVDIAAPGTNILSTYPAFSGCASPCYAWSAGTSMAAPPVSGVAALAGSHEPALLADPVRLRSRLLATGQSLGGTRWSATGRLVNAYHAVDAVAPAAAAPDHFSVKVGTVVGATSVPVQVSWPAATDETSPIAAYTVKRVGPDGTTTLANSTAARTVATRLAYRSIFTFRLNARDAAGNVSAVAVSPVVVPRLHADTSTLARYGSGWRTVASSAALGGRVRTTSRDGASVTITFTGRSFALVASKGPTRGAIKVTVDGVVRPTVSLQRSTTKSRLAVFSTAWATLGRHVIRIEVVGRKRVDLDGFVIVR